MSDYICARCGCEITNSTWLVDSDGNRHHDRSECIEALRAEVSRLNTELKKALHWAKLLEDHADCKTCHDIGLVTGVDYVDMHAYPVAEPCPDCTPAPADEESGR